MNRWWVLKLDSRHKEKTLVSKRSSDSGRSWLFLVWEIGRTEVTWGVTPEVAPRVGLEWLLSFRTLRLRYRFVRVPRERHYDRGLEAWYCTQQALGCTEVLQYPRVLTMLTTLRDNRFPMEWPKEAQRSTEVWRNSYSVRPLLTGDNNYKISTRKWERDVWMRLVMQNDVKVNEGQEHFILILI